MGLTEQWIEQLQQGQLPVGKTLNGQRVGLHGDGGRTRLRRSKKGKRRANGRRGFDGDWREPKLFTLYAIDEQGNRINTVSLPVTNDGTFADVEGFMTLFGEVGDCPCPTGVAAVRWSPVDLAANSCTVATFRTGQ